MNQSVSVNRLYDALIEAREIYFDQQQREVVMKLDRLSEILADRPIWPGERSVFFKKSRWIVPATGLYIWGGVGRGKTFLMDLFVETLPQSEVLRLHFHRFMEKVHLHLTDLKGNENPLEIIGDKLAREAKVLCLDECYVSDIADAMVLGTLFDALFRRGVSLIITSNIEPSALYEHGLQRERFLPAIEKIKTYCDIVNLDSGLDYRLRALEESQLYYCPFNSAALEALWVSIKMLVPGVINTEAPAVEINCREISVFFVAENVIWFDFDILCGDGRATIDYIQIAREYKTVILTTVPKLCIAGDESARRFLNLVDVFYDRGINLLIGADVPINNLYSAGRLEFEMARCKSRLTEMQSKQYLEQPRRLE